jgi:hypothetical protein
MMIRHPTPVEGQRQAQSVGDDEAGVEDQVDPVAQYPAINDLADDFDERQDEEPECRGGGVLVPILPLLVCLLAEGGYQYEGATPTDDLFHRRTSH